MAFYPSNEMSGHAESDPGVKIAPKWRFGAKNHDFRPPGGEGGIGVVQNGHLGVKMTKISIFPNPFGIVFRGLEMCFNGSGGSRTPF